MGIKKTWLRHLKQSSQVFFRLLLRGIASATSTAIHHGFHLLGIQAVGSVQRADGVLQLLERPCNAQHRRDLDRLRLVC